MKNDDELLGFEWAMEMLEMKLLDGPVSNRVRAEAAKIIRALRKEVLKLTAQRDARRKVKR